MRHCSNVFLSPQNVNSFAKSLGKSPAALLTQTQINGNPSRKKVCTNIAKVINPKVSNLSKVSYFKELCIIGNVYR